HALIESQRVIRIVHAAAVALERAGVLALLESVVEVGRQAEAGVDALTLEELGQHRADGGTAGAEADDVELELSALGVGPDAAAVLLPTLAGEELLALLGIELERVVLGEQILHRRDVRAQRRIFGQGQRRRLRGPDIAHVDDLLAVDEVAQRPPDVLVVERRLLVVYRSEEHTSELQSRFDLVCRLLLEKKKE